MVAFAILWTRLRSHSSRKGNVTCVVTVLRSHKEVPWIDPFQQSPECKSVSHTLQSSSCSVHMNVASGNYVITCSGNSHFGLADNAAG